jgi:hypothetical protein
MGDIRVRDGIILAAYQIIYLFLALFGDVCLNPIIEGTSYFPLNASAATAKSAVSADV